MSKKLLYVVTGSVGEHLSLKIIGQLKRFGYQVSCYATSSAFDMAFNNDKGQYEVYKYLDHYGECEVFNQTGVVTHIDLAKEHDVCLIAPATANTIGKLANGISDSPIMDCLAAFIGTQKPLYIAPAMNTHMYLNPMVRANVERLRACGVAFIEPTVKQLACGDYGVGALAHAHSIVSIVDGHRWSLPLDKQFTSFTDYLPTPLEPGSFGFKRTFDRHTGVDIYCEAGTAVRAVENGVVVKIGQFTGKSVGSEWWNETEYIAIRSNHHTVLYGEVEVDKKWKVGDRVWTAQILGKVVPVLPDNKLRPDIRNHSCSMLHIELYTELEDEPVVCGNDNQHAKHLLDPTPFLKLALK